MSSHNGRRFWLRTAKWAEAGEFFFFGAEANPFRGNELAASQGWSHLSAKSTMRKG